MCCIFLRESFPAEYTLLLSGTVKIIIVVIVLQDLSQPKSEVLPPDGALAVSLLRHQVTEKMIYPSLLILLPPFHNILCDHIARFRIYEDNL